MSKSNSPTAQSDIVLSEQEKQVINILRETKYGEVKIIVQNGIPVRVDEIRKSIKL